MRRCVRLPRRCRRHPDHRTIALHGAKTVTRRIALAVLFLLVIGIRPATAQTCSVSYTDLNYATYTGTRLNGTGSGVITCGSAWTLGLNAGLGVGATETIRKMTRSEEHTSELQALRHL